MPRTWHEITDPLRGQSITSGTDDKEKIIQRLAQKLDSLKHEAWQAPDLNDHLSLGVRNEIHRRLGGILFRVTSGERPTRQPSKTEDIIWLTNALNWFSPEGCAFRTNPNDDSNYGWWSYTGSDIQ